MGCFILLLHTKLCVCVGLFFIIINCEVFSSGVTLLPSSELFFSFVKL